MYFYIDGAISVAVSLSDADVHANFCVVYDLVCTVADAVGGDDLVAATISEVHGGGADAIGFVYVYVTFETACRFWRCRTQTDRPS